jgi:exocyst complex component 1
MDGYRGVQAGLDGGNTGNGSMSRAEKFEDEKRRIIESCFSKKGEDGSTCKIILL